MKENWLTVRTLIVSSLTIVALGSESFAQEPRWEIEGHAGFSFAFGGPSGVTALPPAGESYIRSLPQPACLFMAVWRRGGVVG